MIIGLYVALAVLTTIYFIIVDVGLAPEHSDLQRVIIALITGIIFPLFWILIMIAGAGIFYVASKK